MIMKKLLVDVILNVQIVQKDIYLKMVHVSKLVILVMAIIYVLLVIKLMNIEIVVLLVIHLIF